MKKFFVFTILIASLALAGCTVKKNVEVGNDNQNKNTENTASENTQIANPASTYCIEQGGSSAIIETEAGQAGICKFNDGSECDEWAFFRKECKAGNTTAEVDLDVSKWETYKNKELKFEFAHPKDWEQAKEGIPENLIRFVKTDQKTNSELIDGIILSIDANSTGKSLEELVTETENSFLENQIIGGKFSKEEVNFQKNKTEIDGYNGYIISARSTYGGDVNKNSLDERMLIKNANIIYSITFSTAGPNYSNYLKEIDKVVSTFKFTN